MKQKEAIQPILCVPIVKELCNQYPIFGMQYMAVQIMSLQVHNQICLQRKGKNCWKISRQHPGIEKAELIFSGC